MTSYPTPQDNPPPSSPAGPEHLGLDRKSFSDGGPYLVAIPGVGSRALHLPGIDRSGGEELR
jgi:hypothetical protein